jgi:hypothetical protein
MATDKRTCDHCGASLKGKRADALFCSTRCRVAARRDAQRYVKQVGIAARLNMEADEQQRSRRRGPPRAPHLKRKHEKRDRTEARRRAAFDLLINDTWGEGTWPRPPGDVVVEATTIAEAKEVWDRATAMLTWARQIGHAELAADAWETQQRAEVCLGRLLIAADSAPA